MPSGNSRRRLREFRHVVIKPNEFEAVGCADPQSGNLVDAGELQNAVALLRRQTSVPVFVTRDAEGMFVTDPEWTAIPGVDVRLIQDLRRPSTTRGINVGFMGCHGAVNGMRAALVPATSDPDARILMCAMELWSLYYRFQWDPERFIGNAVLPMRRSQRAWRCLPRGPKLHVSSLPGTATCHHLPCCLSSKASAVTKLRCSMWSWHSVPPLLPKYRFLRGVEPLPRIDGSAKAVPPCLCYTHPSS